MSRVAVVPGTKAHARDILANMRGINLVEVERIGVDPCKTMDEAMDRAVLTWAGTINEKLVCLGGIEQATILSDSAYLWLVTTKAVEEHSFIFVRRSQIVLDAIFDRYRMVYGVVDKDFERSIRWLRWLGFSIDPPEGQFRTFSKSRN